MESNVKVLLVMMLLCTSVIFGGILSMPIVIQSSTHVYPDDFEGQTLQQAIWNDIVKDGDKIVVCQGTYYEHLNVNKSITLEGFYRHTTILDGDWNDTVINVTASNVNIFEFTIRNGSKYGVYFNYATNNCNVSRNIITNNLYGICVSGSNHTLRDNNITNNTYNFGASGRHDIDISNKVDGKPIYYFVDQQDKTIPLDAGYVGLVNCTYITARNLFLRKNVVGLLVMSSTNITMQNLDIRYMGIGVSVASSTNITLQDSNIRDTDSSVDAVSSTNITLKSLYLYNNSVGIQLVNSSNNVVFNNTVAGSLVGIDLSSKLPLLPGSYYNIICGNTFNNNVGGIGIMNGTGNIIYQNNFIANNIQAISIETNNYWDNGAEGNYWSDYGGRGDMNCDGINEDPYNISLHGVDRFPLNETWSPVRIKDVSWHIHPDLVRFPYNISILSDHVVACYRDGFKPINWTERTGLITFNITAGSSGYCNVTIPRDRLDYPFVLLVDNVQHGYQYDLNATHVWLYFTYDSGIHNIKIISYRIGWIFGDINGDGKIDMKDIGYVSKNYGKTYPSDP